MIIINKKAKTILEYILYLIFLLNKLVPITNISKKHYLRSNYI